MENVEDVINAVLLFSCSGVELDKISRTCKDEQFYTDFYMGSYSCIEQPTINERSIPPRCWIWLTTDHTKNGHWVLFFVGSRVNEHLDCLFYDPAGNVFGHYPQFHKMFGQEMNAVNVTKLVHPVRDVAPVQTSGSSVCGLYCLLQAYACYLRTQPSTVKTVEKLKAIRACKSERDIVLCILDYFNLKEIMKIVDKKFE